MGFPDHSGPDTSLHKMSSGFVSGGTADAPIARSDEWLAAQREIEANRARKAEQARQADGKSLFETLEANKAAKQEAFEEANRLKNQFRALDEDEVDFLDSVLEKTRADEDRVKRETAEGLELFRRQQDEADKARRSSGGAPEEGSPTIEEEQWVAGGRKRKRVKEKEGLKGVKVRRSSAAGQPATDAKAASTKPSGSSLSPVPNEAEVTREASENSKPSSSVQPLDSTPDHSRSKSSEAPAKAQSLPQKGGLSLVSYDSEEDSD